jgi:hypothetical protein
MLLCGELLELSDCGSRTKDGMRHESRMQVEIQGHDHDNIIYGELPVPSFHTI